MKDAMKFIPWVAAALLLAGLVFTTTKMLQARYDLSVAEANTRAYADTVQMVRTEKENAASLFQLQKEINQDSLRNSKSALALAVLERDLTVKSLQETNIRFDAVQASNTSLVSMINTFNPAGRPERVEAFQLLEENIPTDDEGNFTELPVVGDIVIQIPADTMQVAEIETFLTLLPFGVKTALGCTPEKDVTAIFETPSWAFATPTLGQVDPEVCHGTRPSLFLGMQVTVGGLAVGAGAGALITAVLLGVF